MKAKIYEGILIILFLAACSKKQITIEPISPEIVAQDTGRTMIFPNTEKTGWINLYYKDSLNLSDIFQDYNSNYEFNSEIFSIKNGKLFISKPQEMKSTEYVLEFKGVDKEISKVKVKIKSWKSGVYQLKVFEEFHKQDFYITTIAGLTYLFQNSKLYTISKSGKKSLIGDFVLDDPLYNQMVALDDYYAMRTGAKIFVSRDLKTWEKIYDHKRGIKESMVIFKQNNNVELLFTEYTPGTDYSRHYVRKYSFSSGDIEDVKTFYATGEKLWDRARHIHLLVKDPYSSKIFLGTGDGDDESAIYFTEDYGKTFKKMGGGNQNWRTLSIILNENYMMWNTDSAKPQFLSLIKRVSIRENISKNDISLIPLVNSALWCNEYVNSLNGYLMSSNCEGGIYDNKNRIFFIKFETNGPTIYEVYASECGSVYSQFFPIGQDNSGGIYYKNVINGEIKKFKVVKK